MASCLGELTKVRIWHDNKFLGANWFLESVEIIDESNDEKYPFPCNRWLAKDKDDGSLVRELTCANAKKSNDSPTSKSLAGIVSACEEKNVICCLLYNSPSYSRILIGSCRRSIKGQIQDCRHHHKVFLSGF